MANPRVFVSFDFDNDIDKKHLVIGQSRNPRTPFTIEDWSSKDSLPQSTWKSIVEDKIKKSNVLLVLVGNYMRSATGVPIEINMAKKNNVPVYGIYLDKTNVNLPEGLPSYKTYSWSWENISNILNKAMNEGKNI